MGKCISSNESRAIEQRDNAKANKTDNLRATMDEPVLPEKFKDMPEIDDKYVGEGVRRMKAYKCSLVIDELQKLQEEYWSKC